MTITVMETRKSKVSVITDVPRMEIDEIDTFLNDHGFECYEYMITTRDPAINRYKLNMMLVDA